MQTNDLNKLVSHYEDLTSVSISQIPSGFIGNSADMKALKTAIDESLIRKIRIDVQKYETLGKSRRWIRRWVKRKYNIVEY
jgi:hypothetical protein